MPISSIQFREALGRFSSGVTVVTVASGSEKTGLTVSAFSSVSLNPPLVLVCIDKRSPSIDMIHRVKAFAVNILTDEQAAVSNQFASKTVDKFEGITHSSGPLGQPLLNNALVRMECSLWNAVDAGDHIVFFGQIESSEVNEDLQPLLYYRGQYGSFGPK